MTPTHATTEEGGEWQPWYLVSSLHRMNLLQSIKFDNGVQWDQVNGFRKWIKVRVKMGRAIV